MKKPLVSVLMPNYNCEKYIGEAIESILNQTFTDFEFIIIDDGSTDNSWHIIQEYAKKDTRIIALQNKENLGVSNTRNKGLLLAKGIYIALMDSDDISKNNRIEKQVIFLNKNQKVGIVGGFMKIIDEEGVVYSERKYNFTDSEIRKKLFRYSPFCHPLVMIRKKVLEKSGFYDTQLHVAEDYDLYFRIGMYSNFANINDFLLFYRMRKNNSTNLKMREMEMKTLEVRKKAKQLYGYKMTIMDKAYYYLQFFLILKIS